jgi:hypothetical protein
MHDKQGALKDGHVYLAARAAPEGSEKPWYFRPRYAACPADAWQRCEPIAQQSAAAWDVRPV